MTRLTPEREKEIRDWLKSRTPDCEEAEAIPELLAEIDVLRAENFHYNQQYFNQKCATDDFQLKVKGLEKERDQFRTRVAKLREALIQFRVKRWILFERGFKHLKGEENASKMDFKADQMVKPVDEARATRGMDRVVWSLDES